MRFMRIKHIDELSTNNDLTYIQNHEAYSVIAKLYRNMEM